MPEEDKAEKNEEAARGAEGAQARDGMPDWVRFPLVLAVVCAVSALGLAGVYALTRANIEKSERRKITGTFEDILGEDYSEEKTERTSVAEGGRLLKRYVVRGAAGNVLAHAGVVKCPGSYNASEPIQLVVVLDPGLARVLGVGVVASKETPGLGSRIKDPPSALSIIGWIAGRPERERVVMKEGGALVGTVEEKDDGSIVFRGPDGGTREFKKGEAEVTRAPFPPAFLDQFTGVPAARAKLSSAGGAVDAITGATVSSRAVVGGVSLAVEELRAAARK